MGAHHGQSNQQNPSSGIATVGQPTTERSNLASGSSDASKVKDWCADSWRSGERQQWNPCRATSDSSRHRDQPSSSPELVTVSPSSAKDKHRGCSGDAQDPLLDSSDVKDAGCADSWRNNDWQQLNSWQAYRPASDQVQGDDPTSFSDHVTAGLSSAENNHYPRCSSSAFELLLDCPENNQHNAAAMDLPTAVHAFAMNLQGARRAFGLILAAHSEVACPSSDAFRDGAAIEHARIALPSGIIREADDSCSKWSTDTACSTGLLESLADATHNLAVAVAAFRDADRALTKCYHERADHLMNH